MVEARLALLRDVCREHLHLVALAAHVLDVLVETDCDAVGLGRHVVGDDEDPQVGLLFVRRRRAHEPRDCARKLREQNDAERDEEAREEDEDDEWQTAEPLQRDVRLVEAETLLELPPRRALHGSRHRHVLTQPAATWHGWWRRLNHRL